MGPSFQKLFVPDNIFEFTYSILRFTFNIFDNPDSYNTNYFFAVFTDITLFNLKIRNFSMLIFSILDYKLLRLAEH